MIFFIVKCKSGGAADVSLTTGFGSSGFTSFKNPSLTSCFPGIIELMTKAFKGFTYEGMDYKEDLRRRDMMDLPKYWHRDDAIILWDATFNYVKEMTDVFYVSDDDVLEDWELQAWVEDIFNHGFSQLEGTVKPGIGIPSKLNSKEELVILKTYKCNTNTQKCSRNTRWGICKRSSTPALSGTPSQTSTPLSENQDLKH